MVAALIFLFLTIFIIVPTISAIRNSIRSKGDETITVKSRQAVEKYDLIKYFREDTSRLSKVATEIERMGRNYKLKVLYVSPAGRSFNYRIIEITPADITYYRENPTALMTQTEINKLKREERKAEKEKEKELKKQQKEQEKADLENKQHEFYDRVNKIIDNGTATKDSIIIKEDQDKIEDLLGNLFEKTVNSIKKVKALDSEEWGMFDKLIDNTSQEINEIAQKSTQLVEYYNSSDFEQIKETCNSLMDSQREFNEYIDEKAKSISQLFGTRVVRNETVNADVYDYIRPYKKTLTPFTAEVSKAVFASAENNPMEYIVKNFYPRKSDYPEQIQKLQLLIGELETLRDAKEIIENYKKDYQQYLTNVPDYVMENDADGFYSRLGFATINESVLTVAYKFSYTSDGGMAHRSFTVPMTEETIVELIETLENKLSQESFVKEQRALMTQKLRNHIKERDDFTCKTCGNSTHKEPNLLLEIDHIIPISKGGLTEEDNLQTLCWRCNRAKGSKVV